MPFDGFQLEVNASLNLVFGFSSVGFFPSNLDEVFWVKPRRALGREYLYLSSIESSDENADLPNSLVSYVGFTSSVKLVPIFWSVLRMSAILRWS